MLPVIRQSLRGLSVYSRRALTTAATTSSSSSPNPLADLPPSSSTGLVAETSQDASTSISVTPLAPPVYVKMASLLPLPKDLEDQTSHPLGQVVELDPFIFAHPIRRDILHSCVVHYLDSLRQGTASTKTRGDVRGSGRKIRPQKGTGRARLGDGQSPMLRGGGVAFGPKPRDFSTKLNRKVVQMGYRVALSVRLKEQALGVVQSLEWPGFKTKEFASRVRALGWQRTLFVTGQESIPEGLDRSSRNIQNVLVLEAKDLTVYDLVKWPRVVMDIPAVEFFEQHLGKGVESSWPNSDSDS